MLGQFHASSDFTPVEKVSPIHGIGGWLEPRTDMGVLGKRQIFFPCQESKPRTSGLYMGKKVKQSRYRPGVAQGVPGS